MLMENLWSLFHDYDGQVSVYKILERTLFTHGDNLHMCLPELQEPFKVYISGSEVKNTLQQDTFIYVLLYLGS